MVRRGKRQLFYGIKGIYIACYAVFNLYPDFFSSVMNQLVYRVDLCSDVQCSRSGDIWPIGVKNEFKGFV